MKIKILVLVILAIALVGMAGAVEPFEISGKDFADIEQFNGTDDLVNEDLAGTSASMMGLDESFLRDNPEDGKPINQSKPVLALGSMTGYNRTAQFQDEIYWTPEELELMKNTSTWIEILPEGI